MLNTTSILFFQVKVHQLVTVNHFWGHVNPPQLAGTLMVTDIHIFEWKKGGWSYPINCFHYYTRGDGNLADETMRLFLKARKMAAMAKAWLPPHRWQQSRRRHSRHCTCVNCQHCLVVKEFSLAPTIVNRLFPDGLSSQSLSLWPNFNREPGWNFAWCRQTEVS